MADEQDRGILSDLAAKVTGSASTALSTEEKKDSHTGLKIGAGILGVAAVAGVGYLAYDQWIKHHNKADDEHAKEEFKKIAVEKEKAHEEKKEDKEKSKDKEGKKEKKDKKVKKDKKEKKEKKDDGDSSSSSSDSDSD